jgi:uncharacterized membrane protein
MRQMLTTGLLWFSVLGCGLMAGVYFAFSSFVMASLARLAPAAGMAAMNAINLQIVRSLFMPLFLGTTLAAALLAGLAVLRWSEAGTAAMLAGGLVYCAGMFAVTALWNVPLNDALAATDPASTEATSLWARYLRDWTYWNHIRTVASLASAVLFMLALLRGGATAS